MYDIHALPTVTLRDFIKQSQSGDKMTSVQMTETLIHAGLLNPLTKRTYTAWESSRAFKGLLQWNHPTVNYLDSNNSGQSMDLGEYLSLLIFYLISS